MRLRLFTLLVLAVLSNAAKPAEDSQWYRGKICSTRQWEEGEEHVANQEFGKESDCLKAMMKLKEPDNFEDVARDASKFEPACWHLKNVWNLQTWCPKVEESNGSNVETWKWKSYNQDQYICVSCNSLGEKGQVISVTDADGNCIPFSSTCEAKCAGYFRWNVRGCRTPEPTQTPEPTHAPTSEPTEEPTEAPTEEPTTADPTTAEPTTAEPTSEPTPAPSTRAPRPTQNTFDGEWHDQIAEVRWYKKQVCKGVQDMHKTSYTGDITYLDFGYTRLDKCIQAMANLKEPDNFKDVARDASKFEPACSYIKVKGAFKWRMVSWCPEMVNSNLSGAKAWKLAKYIQDNYRCANCNGVAAFMMSYTNSEGVCNSYTDGCRIKCDGIWNYEEGGCSTDEPTPQPTKELTNTSEPTAQTFSNPQILDLLWHKSSQCKNAVLSRDVGVNEKDCIAAMANLKEPSDFDTNARDATRFEPACYFSGSTWYLITYCPEVESTTKWEAYIWKWKKYNRPNYHCVSCQGVATSAVTYYKDANREKCYMKPNSCLAKCDGAWNYNASTVSCPTPEPTLMPTREPTPRPTPVPTVEPTLRPTQEPTLDPTQGVPLNQLEYECISGQGPRSKSARLEEYDDDMTLTECKAKCNSMDECVGIDHTTKDLHCRLFKSVQNFRMNAGPDKRVWCIRSKADSTSSSAMRRLRQSRK